MAIPAVGVSVRYRRFKGTARIGGKCADKSARKGDTMNLIDLLYCCYLRCR